MFETIELVKNTIYVVATVAGAGYLLHLHNDFKDYLKNNEPFSPLNRYKTDK
jgi:hypothetical protein